jgi:competence protein ComEA
MRSILAIGLAIWFGVSPVVSAHQGRRAKKADSKPAHLVLDVNRASAADFQKLPGIGPKLAEKIVAYREKHGSFRRVEDLMVIKGIGVKKWKALRPYLRVGDDTHKRQQN